MEPGIAMGIGRAGGEEEYEHYEMHGMGEVEESGVPGGELDFLENGNSHGNSGSYQNQEQHHQVIQIDFTGLICIFLSHGNPSFKCYLSLHTSSLSLTTFDDDYLLGRDSV